MRCFKWFLVVGVCFLLGACSDEGAGKPDTGVDAFDSGQEEPVEEDGGDEVEPDDDVIDGGNDDDYVGDGAPDGAAPDGTVDGTANDADGDGNDDGNVNVDGDVDVHVDGDVDVDVDVDVDGGVDGGADDGQAGDEGGDEGPVEPVWPEWAFHHWIWEGESTQESAIAIAQGYLDNDIPVGAIIIDSPWATGYNTFDWDPVRFPDPQAMIDHFHSLGIRVMLWVVPAINLDVTDLYQHCADNDFFMKRSAFGGPAVIDWWKGEGSLIDYFGSDAVDWWHEQVDKALAFGIDGWKCDGLDYYAISADYSPGLGASVERIEYSHAYYRDFFDYTRAALGDDRIITSRPIDNYGIPIGGELVAFAPVDITFAGWVGDQDGTFRGLEKALNNMYFSAEMGYLAFGSDIGGYRTDDTAPPEWGRTKELFIRWAELGAMCPVMENGGGGEHRPWMYDSETVDIYRRFVNLHYALIPYLMESGARAYADGVSLMTFFDDDEYHYLLGPEILVAPMLESGTSRQVTFPAGDNWVYLFDKTRIYTGGSVETLTIPLDEFPVFLKEGSDLVETITVE